MRDGRRLAAAMRVHGLGRILTLNVAHFSRYPGIVAVHPGDVAQRHQIVQFGVCGYRGLTASIFGVTMRVVSRPRPVRPFSCGHREGRMVPIHPQYIVDENQHRQAVLVPLAEWEQIVEELDDIRAYDEAKAGPQESVSFEQAVREIEEGRDA